VKQQEAVSEKELVPSFWISGGMRYLKNPPSILSKYQQGRFSYLARGMSELNWVWGDNAGVDNVRSLLSKLNGFLVNITRIAIIIQKPGYEVPTHRDLIVGSNYSNLKDSYSTFLGSQELIYFGEDWFHKLLEIPKNTYHSDQNYFGLRIPISEKPGENGRPYVINEDGKKEYYDFGNNLFLLNEAHYGHGADPVDFYRGVIIVDGKLNLEHLDKYS
jgi:hypothetical protein